MLYYRYLFCCMCVLLIFGLYTSKEAHARNAVLRKNLVEEFLAQEGKWNISVQEDCNNNNENNTTNWYVIEQVNVERDAYNKAITISFMYNHLHMNILCENLLSNTRVAPSSSLSSPSSTTTTTTGITTNSKSEMLTGQCFFEVSNSEGVIDNEVYFMFRVQHTNKQATAKHFHHFKSENEKNSSNKQKNVTYVGKDIQMVALYSNAMLHTSTVGPASSNEHSSSSPSLSDKYVGDMLLIEEIQPAIAFLPKYTLTFDFSNVRSSLMSSSEQEKSENHKYLWPRAIRLDGMIREDEEVVAQRNAYRALSSKSNLFTRWGYPVILVCTLYVMGWLLVKCAAHQ